MTPLSVPYESHQHHSVELVCLQTIFRVMRLVWYGVPAGWYAANDLELLLRGVRITGREGMSFGYSIEVQ